MPRLIAAVVVLIWLLYGLARLVAPSAMVGLLEPVGTAAAIVGLLCAPALVVATLLAAGLALRKSARTHTALALLSLGGTIAVLAPRPTDSAPAGGALTVMSWNVGRLGGIHARDGKTAADEAKVRTTACLANQLSLIEPDVLVLTEISRYDVESILEPALGSLSRKCVHAAHDAGKQLSSGTLVCAWSAYLSLADQTVVSVPQDGLTDQQFPLVRLSGKGGNLQVAALHLPPVHRAPERWPSWIRAGLAAAAQEAMLDSVTEALEPDWPTVLAGDFNQSRHVWLHERLRQDYRDVFESTRAGLGGTRLIGKTPVARIDYIYADRARLDVVDASVVRVGCADHDPVVGRVRLR